MKGGPAQRRSDLVEKIVDLGRCSVVAVFTCFLLLWYVNECPNEAHHSISQQIMYGICSMGFCGASHDVLTISEEVKCQNQHVLILDALGIIPHSCNILFNLEAQMFNDM